MALAYGKPGNWSTYGLAGTLNAPFYTGIASSVQVPGLYTVAIGGRTYALDLESKEMKHESIPLIRRTFDTVSKPGEGAINPEDLWRRTQETWHLGAGQIFADRATSIEGRYNASKGVNPWTKWQFSLLPDTNKALTSANTNLGLVTAGAWLYVIDGQVLKYTQDITVGSPSWTSVTGNPAVTPSAVAPVASDGNNVWTAYGASGIYSTTRGAASQASYVTGTVTSVWYAKGRLMCSSGASLYNPTAAGALPTPLFTHANSDFTWVSVSEGPGQIYAAGFSGDKSLIYRCPVRSDGTALDAPIVAGELPDGEIVRVIHGYLGSMLIGSDKGWRLANVDASGMLTIGPLFGSLVGIANPVKAMEPNDRFVWFAWTNYDGTSTGLGRIDLSSRTTDSLSPPFASDLMATTQGAVNSIASFQSIRAFSVSGVGVYAEKTTLVSSGTITSGLFGFDIVDTKTAVKAEVKTGSLPAGASYTYDLALEDAAFSTMGTQMVAASLGIIVSTNRLRGERFESRLTLNRGTDTTTGPTIKRYTLKADPSSALNEVIHVPLLIHERIEQAGQSINLDPEVELAFIKNLRATRQIINYQEGITNYVGVVKDYTWVPYRPTIDKTSFNGTCVVQIKTLS